ncbi:MAG TPA: S8 family peptidase [Noviherbaspirillum sp.]|uniref:S8 family peptidase n=1 Tax=Noviherbaspirillum sp. TaxID=1926288 RepID=UPI002B4838F6|nr:S8 family peptidase [Noviherbaspirillum sp.]HJV83929.1 S8 family peptidase [Noviherbaspirillum sp.]
MFTSSLFPRSVFALALAAAFTASVRAEDASALGTGANDSAQTPAPAAAIVDAERGNSSSILNRIKADAAYLRGITGSGVTIAVLDTGINASHREFAMPGKLVQGYNAIDGGSDVTDRSGHGTHVAGILAADRDGRGIFGIAYDARLLPVKVFTDSGMGSTAALDRGLRYAIGRAAIVNMSLGAAGSYDPQAMQEAVHAGMLLVVAAGNDHARNPDWPARFAKENWAGSQIIAVGAVDAANRIAAYSNRAGDTAPWFLVAPGSSIVSTYPVNQYAAMSGTSMATPMVSAAAALVKQLWPSLSAEQIATILFVTATDLGAPGIDPVYGRGLLNIDKALQPIGAVTTTTLNGKRINVLAGSVQPSSATSMLWNLAAAGQLRVFGVDDFQRDFQVDMGAAVARPTPLSLDNAFDDMDRRMAVVDRLLDDGSRLAVAFGPASPASSSWGMGATQGAARRQLVAFSLTSRAGSSTETAFGMGGMAGMYFGAGGLRLTQGAPLDQVAALSNPYFTLVPGAAHAALAQQVGEVKLKFGVLSSSLNRMLASQDGIPLPSAPDLAHASSALFEISRSFGDAALSLSMSQTSETNAYLGSYSSGPLSIGPVASTGAVQVAGAVLLAPKVTLAGQAAYGVTPGTASRDSLVTDISRARTNAFSLALVAADRIRRGDRMSLSLSQPMRTYAGRIVMDMLTGDGMSSPSRERLVFSMVPLGREMRAELNYLVPAGREGSLGVSFTVRRDPNNLIDVSVEKLLAVRFATAF